MGVGRLELNSPKVVPISHAIFQSGSQKEALGKTLPYEGLIILFGS